MAQHEGPKYKFEHQLRLEADRVIEDVVFQRAPIQTRLLKFLVEKTLNSPAPPTQYEIAVYGLGKDEDYDLESDSYPRVQISRLRRRIENYYARNQAQDGLRLKLEAGSYRLTLEAAEPHEQAPLTEEPAPETAPPTPKKEKLSPKLMGAAALGILGLFTAPMMIMGLSEPRHAKVQSSLSKPSTALIIKASPNDADNVDMTELVEKARHISEVQLKRSFVSKPLMIGEEASNAEYALNFNFGPGNGKKRSLFLSLRNGDGDVLYSNEMVVDPDQPKSFSSELEASIVYIVSPTGAIAQAELPKRKNATASDYACFLTIENRRSVGKATIDQVNQCLERFPDSEYVPFWYSRLAFVAYREDAEAGRAIRKSGPGWTNLRSAMEADRYNPMANFIAAKVEVSYGRCREASAYMERVLERGNSYPALVAAAEASATTCASSAEDDVAKAARIRAMAKFNRDPDPLLHLYLMLASLSVGDRDGALRISKKSVIDDPVGSMETTSDLLTRSLADRGFAKSNERKIRDAVRRIVWNDGTTSEIVETLVERS